MHVSRPERQGGFGIIETMIAIMVLSIFVLSIGSFFSSISSTTGQANLEVTATGLARQELTYWQQQLAADTQYDFPMPFPCAVTNGGGQPIAASVCPGQNVNNATTGAVAAGPATEYIYCYPIGQQNTPPACDMPITITDAVKAASSYTVTTYASWQCDPYSYSATGNMAAMPYLYINVQVTWPHMAGLTPQPNTASPGNTASPVSVSAEVAPPSGVYDGAVGVASYPNGPPQAVGPQDPATAGTPSQGSGSASNTGNNTCVGTS